MRTHNHKLLCFSGGTATGLHGPSSLTYGTTRPTLTRRVLRYLKTNLPELGHRAGRGQIVLRLQGLGRTELPVWVRLLHGCLRGVDILRHGRARRSVGRRGAATGGSARNLEAGGLLECAKRLVEAPRVLHHTHARETEIAQSGRTGAGRRGRERGGRGGGTPRRLLDARAKLLVLRLLLRLQLLASHLRREGKHACAREGGRRG